MRITLNRISTIPGTKRVNDRGFNLKNNLKTILRIARNPVFNLHRSNSILGELSRAYNSKDPPGISKSFGGGPPENDRNNGVTPASPNFPKEESETLKTVALSFLGSLGMSVLAHATKVLDPLGDGAKHLLKLTFDTISAFLGTLAIAGFLTKKIFR